MIGQSAMEYLHVLQRKWPQVRQIKQRLSLDLLSSVRNNILLSHTGFSLSAYKRNKRKMELAEGTDAEHHQMKKRRQSSENVSFVLRVKVYNESDKWSTSLLVGIDVMLLVSNQYVFIKNNYFDCLKWTTSKMVKIMEIVLLLKPYQQYYKYVLNFFISPFIIFFCQHS